MSRDDVIQEALTRAWQKRATYDPRRGSFDVWLLAITADRARKARRRPSVAFTLGTDTQGLATNDRMDIERATSELPPRQRLAVNCYDFAGLSIAQTAAVMDCAEGTVKSTLSDARARLRPLLEVRDGQT